MAAEIQNSQAKQIAKIAILLGLGSYFIYTILSGSINNYINPEWGWLCWVAAAFCFLLGGVSGFTFIMEWKERKAHEAEDIGHAHMHDHSHDHDHSGHNHKVVSWSVLGVLGVPLALGLAVPSQALGASSLSNNTGAATSFMETSGAAHDDPLNWNIWDWQRTYHANVHPNSWFNGKLGTMIGFVFHPQGADPDEFVLARYVMRHCAADAFGVGILVKWPGGDKLPTDTWVKVQGDMEIEKFQGEETLLVEGKVLDDKIGDPLATYIYPSFYTFSK